MAQPTTSDLPEANRREGKPSLRPETAALASRTEGVSARYESSQSKSSYAGYLFGSSGTDARPALSDSMQGRAMIRLVSRGVVGSAFFVLGTHLAKQQLEGYEPWRKATNPLQKIAKALDRTVGNALEKTAFHLTPGDMQKKADAAWEITNFRTKMYSGPEAVAYDTARGGRQPGWHVDRWNYVRPLNGRSLGAEMVSVTFDFFMASIGDAATRNIFQALDPNVKQPWLLDKEGHATTRDQGKFDAGRWLQAVGRSSFRILTKNAGEDWAAALPYVYQMKWQRQALAKRWKGFKLASDHGWNGGMGKVVAQATPEHYRGEVVGGYQLPGAIDLQARFVGYNWYTLMYREAYDAVGRGIDKLRHGGVHLSLPQHFNPLTAALHGVGFTGRYVAKSFIKANLYMQPAVPIFWLFRTPQSKYKGGYGADNLLNSNALSDQSQGALFTRSPQKALVEGAEKGDANHLVNYAQDIFPRYQAIHDPQLRNEAHWGNGNVIRRSDMPPGKLGIFADHPYALKGVKRTWFEQMLNPFGWVCFQSGTGLTHAVDWATKHRVDPVTKLLFKGSKSTNLLLDREKLLRSYADAAWSYTPYMWLKAETALRVDDRRSSEQLGHMDKAIYRMLDSAATFKFKDAFKAGAEVIDLGLHYEKDVKSREGGLVEEATPTPKVDASSIAHEGARKHDPAALDKGEGAQRNWASATQRSPGQNLPLR